MPSLVLLALGLLTTLHLFTASDGEIAASGAYQSGRPLLYVASLSGEVTAYDPASSGVVSPVRRLAGPITGLKDSWAVAFDTAGDLFVQNFLGDSTTGVFGPDVNGDTAPLRVFKNEATTRDNGGFLVVNYSPFTNLIYAAVSGDFIPDSKFHRGGETILNPF